VSLVTGVLLSTWFNDARGSGVPQTKTAYHLRQGVIPLRVPIGKFVTGVLCIGSGHSMGREGPSVQIGAGLASAVGQWLRLPADRVKKLVPVGASAALAAAFNTPVAAVLFALEEIIADLNATLLGSTVIASVAAVIVARSLLGNEPLFHVPEYELQHPLELVAYLFLGIVGGLASVAFGKGLLGARRYFLSWPLWTRRWQPALGGLVIGCVLLVYPQVAGVGYTHIDQALNGGMVMTAMIGLALVKGGATIVSYSTGNAGGIFAPSLFLGAMVGGAVGFAVQWIAPMVGVPVGEPGAYALVGMGTLFAGIIRAPLTSVFMIFEITQDYQIFVPLMVANMISLFISRRYQKQAVYSALLAQDGVHLPAPVQAAAGGWRAGDVMRADADGLFVDRMTPASEALARADAAGSDGLLVGRRDDFGGLVTREALVRASAAGRGDQAVHELTDAGGAHVHADHAIDVVLDRFSRSPAGLLPVLRRQNVRSVEGVITRDTLLGVFGEKRLARERARSGG
jgi:CIC family chloride channel protein